MSTAQRRLYKELADLLDRYVTAFTVNGESFSGRLIGIDPESFTLCLADAKDKEGKSIHRIFLSGNVISSLFAMEKPFDLTALAERLEKVFPTLVDKSNIDKGFIWVMGKIKVTKDGVVEGSGPAAERVQRIYELFMKEREG